MRLSPVPFALLVLGLLILLGSAIMMFRLSPPAPPEQDPALANAAAAGNGELAALPEPQPLHLHGLAFSVDRERFLVKATSVATGETAWESSGQDRFIVPGDAFPLDLSPEGNLWVANVGRKRLEQLDPRTGRFLAAWQPQEPFRGCCNPVRFAALRHGRFVTMEKGTRQARLFDPAGNEVSVITDDLPPSEFDYGLIHVPDAAYIIDRQRQRVWTVPDPGD
ncbi:MAG: hypothetical protein PHC30_00605 [Lentisphaeria bacterium]|jgi:hypothetical protein|nr:hypothetical protein [Lentisphaeria bacterium]